ncbi:MAG: hypothetical protein ABS99_09745 [Acetobacteraceae bacterium SCN 69-10]|nr:MAG: hypothetical protein ABS99_09745 [Acetobacteraceae bacterium SCN 69-10]
MVRRADVQRAARHQDAVQLFDDGQEHRRVLAQPLQHVVGDDLLHRVVLERVGGDLQVPHQVGLHRLAPVDVDIAFALAASAAEIELHDLPAWLDRRCWDCDGTAGWVALRRVRACA